MAELAEGGILWKKPFAAESSIALTGNAVLVGGMDEVRAFDVEDGREVWTAKARRRSPRPGGGRRPADCQHQRPARSTPLPALRPTTDAAVVRAASPKAEAFPHDDRSEFYEQAAREILANSGVTTGYCLVLGNEEGRLAYELARQAPQLRIYAVEPDEAKVQRSRERFAAAGWYGTRVTVFHGTAGQDGALELLRQPGRFRQHADERQVAGDGGRTGSLREALRRSGLLWSSALGRRRAEFPPTT